MASLRSKLIISGSSLLIVGILAGFLAWEFTTSTLQAKYLSEYAARMHFKLEPGPSPSIRFPHDGPYDVRFGYTQLPDFSKRLTDAGFTISAQARISPAMAQMADKGLFLPYHEKDQAGLTLYDTNGTVMFSSRTPHHVFDSFQAIPPLIRNSLLFIENRELLSTENPKRNPAVEWDRLAQAVTDKIIQIFHPAHDVPGGSTLATQIEKYRHSPDGLTLSMGDKLKQMESASVRAYLDGENTLATRRRLVLDYLNTVPLSAAPGYGEVIGLPDALKAWYGLDYHEVVRLLNADQPDHATANAFKHTLSLLIAQRKPSFYLGSNHTELNELTNSYVRLMAREGLISPALRNAALSIPLHFNIQRAASNTDFVEQKAANAVRSRLAILLGMHRLYNLDRLDLTASSTLNAAAQKAVTRLLVSLNTPEGVQAIGAYGRNLLSQENDLSQIIYSFTLYEMTPQGALLRVQADNLNQPFDINRGAKLDLGSTAKLRTLISYLEIVSKLHDTYLHLSDARLHEIARQNNDAIAQWAAQYLLTAQDKSLAAMLEEAMNRTYSADPSTGFFTGGGLLHFANFNKDDNGRHMNLWEATRNSVNLVYIRVMRDIERHYIAQNPGVVGKILEDANNPARKTYLERFADREGQAFLLRFHKKYRGLNPDQITEKLFSEMHPIPRRLAAVYRYVIPGAPLSVFASFLRSHVVAGTTLSDREIQALYTQQATDAYSLADRGYISQIHPLELWLVRYLRSHPNATFSNIVAASHDQRLEVYSWLFKTSRKNAQDQRIHSLLEVEAFQNIFLDWKRLGYPFDSLVPSYATAIGSSADRPAALAELMGVIVNNGVRLPAVSIQKLHFAAGTPYDTVFVRQQPQGERLLPAELTQVVRRALQGVVEKGTAARLNGAFKDADGNPIPMGGKTGTGDQRYKTFGAGGNLLTSRVVNRTATIVFFLGDRFFGTMTALVPGEKAAAYRFTSSLPAQILKEMGPALSSVLTPIKEQTSAKIKHDAVTESQPESAPRARLQPHHAIPQEKPERHLPPEATSPGSPPKTRPKISAPSPATAAPDKDIQPKSEETY
ncbi:MAG: transglycosylase domain-containing protein [Pseudomonadota bacterium]